MEAAGGAVSFRTYMEWALHDPLHGAYGSGRLRIGPRGDFATSPSLGPAFARLLAPQLLSWLTALGGARLSLVETGPGEGHLAHQLVAELLGLDPALASRLELVLVEPNPGMVQRQRQRLADCPLPVRWQTWRDLARDPVRGVMLAHEVLDALAVERVLWDGHSWRRQGVALVSGPGGEGLELVGSPPLGLPPPAQAEPGGSVDGPSPPCPWDRPQERAWVEAELQHLGLVPPPQPLPAGWCSELHPGLGPWLGAAAAALAEGPLLVVDYALEAHRYYAPSRSAGTLMAYRRQRASSDPLLDPGATDLTAHLCLDSLARGAEASGWRWLGEGRQGQALLALGLALALHRLQDPQASPDLAGRLAERETLLRLVDPAGLGGFRWIALARGDGPDQGPLPLFLREPEG